MSIVISDRVSLLNHVKPFKTTWKVEVKVLHSWTQHSNYTGGYSVQFILADKTGVKIHCTCKRLFLARVKKLQIGAWRFIENFAVTPAGGKYRPTSHEYKMSILSNSNVTESSLKNDDFFFVINQFSRNHERGVLIQISLLPIDNGDLQVVAVQTKETKKLELTLRDTEMPNNEQNNELALTTGCREVVKPKGNKRQPDKWSLYSERTILDIIMYDKCIVKATVYAIDTDWAWYYFGCVKCHYKKVTNITNKELVPVKHLWFKLHLLIKDDTGETKVMLLDTIVEPILGVEDPEDLLNAITDLIGKTLMFGVYVGKYNVDYGSHICNIGKTWSADEIISESDDENSEDTLTNGVSSDRSSRQVSFITIDSEDNTCLSLTPLSKRKVDNEIEDLFSTSKKQKTVLKDYQG
ncbi:hypothetical protein DY000_02023861 [Brassica cretica]|uniref:Replication protein A 70 kDa DNA-binding subunit B/D first OB fold domain-containing protein n=1 Tax=Brassica cretica TaxID=69181 RepID=A0ABQ7E8Q1_BRACR|nr:hypothetical protein DY000_02023861 [Brassica cretica]